MEWSLKDHWCQFEVWIGLQLAPVLQFLCDPGSREDRVQVRLGIGSKTIIQSAENHGIFLRSFERSSRNH